MRLFWALPVLLIGCISNESTEVGDGFCSEENIGFEETYSYDDQSRLVKFIFRFRILDTMHSIVQIHKSDGTISQSSYTGGRLESEECFYTKGDTTSDSISLWTCPPDEKLLSLSRKDSIGRLIEYFDVNGNHELELTRSYEYDDSSNSFKTFEYDDGGKQLYSVTYLDENKKYQKIDLYDGDSTEIHRIIVFEYFPDYVESKMYEGPVHTGTTREYLNRDGLPVRRVFCSIGGESMAARKSARKGLDGDLNGMSRDELVSEVSKLRAGIREHRDASLHELCWHHPQLWGLLPEKTDPRPAVPAWPQFLEGCIHYRKSLDEQLANAPRSQVPYDGKRK